MKTELSSIRLYYHINTVKCLFQVLLTPLADSTVVPSAKMNCRLWVTVHFALGNLFSELELV